MKKGKNRKQQSNDELDLSHLNETVEETERRRDAEANLTQLHGRNAGSPDFDAPFAAGLGSAGIIPNNEDGDYRDTGSGIRFDLGDGSIEGMSDLNDVSGNPEVYNRRANADELADLSEGGIGGMTIEHINDIEHGTGALPEEVKEHEAKRTAQRIHFKKTEGNPLLEPAKRGANNSTAKPEIETRRTVGTKKASVKQKPTAKKATKKSAVKKSSTKSSAKKSSAKKSAAKKSGAKKTAVKKSSSRKSSSKKSSSKKSSSKKSPSKKSSSKKSPAKKSSTKANARKKSSTKSKSSGKTSKRSNRSSRSR